MDETHVVTVFLRDGGEVLLRRRDEAGSYPGRWGAVVGHAEGDPDYMAREAVREETGLVSALCEYEIDALVVGSDTVFADGSVLNKVGTRNAAIAAAHEGIPTYAVTASAKISVDFPADADLEARDRSELYDVDETSGFVDGESAIDAWNPMFDVTPPRWCLESVPNVGCSRPVTWPRLPRSSRSLQPGTSSE